MSAQRSTRRGSSELAPSSLGRRGAPAPKVQTNAAIVCLGHPAVQYYNLHGPADPQRAPVLCPIRTGGHRGSSGVNDRSGSIATVPAGPTCPLMSASPRKRPRRYAEAKCREGPEACPTSPSKASSSKITLFPPLPGAVGEAEDRVSDSGAASGAEDRLTQKSLHSITPTSQSLCGLLTD
jgi:hypothetical protein